LSSALTGTKFDFFSNVFTRPRLHGKRNDANKPAALDSPRQTSAETAGRGVSEQLTWRFEGRACRLGERKEAIVAKVQVSVELGRKEPLNP
jgi:hypothetical protein